MRSSLSPEEMLQNFLYLYTNKLLSIIPSKNPHVNDTPSYIRPFYLFLIWESPCQWSIFTCPSFLFSGLSIILSMTFPLMSVQFIKIPHLHPAPLSLGNQPGRAEGQLAGLYASLYKKKTQSFFHFEQFSFLPYVPMST